MHTCNIQWMSEPCILNTLHGDSFALVTLLCSCISIFYLKTGTEGQRNWRINLSPAARKAELGWL